MPSVNLFAYLCCETILMNRLFCETFCLPIATVIMGFLLSAPTIHRQITSVPNKFRPTIKPLHCSPSVSNGSELLNPLWLILHIGPTSGRKMGLLSLHNYTLRQCYHNVDWKTRDYVVTFAKRISQNSDTFLFMHWANVITMLTERRVIMLLPLQR